MQRPREAEATDLKKRIWIARQRDSPFVGTALAGSGVLASSREGSRKMRRNQSESASSSALRMTSASASMPVQYLMPMTP